MISKECFISQWIEDISARLEYNDKNLIEKVIRALSLLEMLVRSGCPLTFKGLCIATHKPLNDCLCVKNGIFTKQTINNRICQRNWIR